ncbi:lipoprotein-releasing ABC transporter permease subunit [Alteromonas sp. ASW11-36]|uniref:Lipoprotein-releasing ABC transporter permease subunit n=1 Tax=Alteromonas arenosi TaxID=3055817 RepID=A0ABT7SY27_9ALTE|nr:lipoprotein-releasing ABC transporter permease subunit [Alteromonas sp. ASW11-36]MDM7861099.1 lipoprotein-releasing ABC transporter permease subunit [Alteromonas sp. ASW11-36]
MFHPVFAFIGLRYSRASQASSFVAFINFFSVTGITLGIMALIIVLSVMNGFEGQLKQRILGIMPHLTVATAPEKITFVDQSRVVGTMPYLEAEGVIQTPTELRGVAIQGIMPEQMQSLSIVAQSLVVGSFDSLTEKSFRIIVGQALAAQLNIRPGDPLRLLVAGASVYTPFGQVPSQRLVEVVGVFNVGSELDDKTIYMNAADLQRLLRQRGAIDNTRVFLDDAFAYEAIAQEIEAQGLVFETWRARQGPLFDAVKMEKNMMFLLLLLVIAVAAFNIVSALVMIVNEKQGDIAILMSLGMAKSEVMKIFLFNGVANGLKGAILGTVLGVLVVWQLNTILDLFNVNTGYTITGGLPVDMRVEQVIAVTLFSLLLCILATIYPALKALRVQPARALQYE